MGGGGGGGLLEQASENTGGTMKKKYGESTSYSVSRFITLYFSSLLQSSILHKHFHSFYSSRHFLKRWQGNEEEKNANYGCSVLVSLKSGCSNCITAFIEVTNFFKLTSLIQSILLVSIKA